MLIHCIFSRILRLNDGGCTFGYFFQFDGVIAPYSFEIRFFLFGNVQEVHNVKKLGIMLVNLRFINFFKRRVHLVRRCRQQQHSHLIGIKKLICKQSCFGIRIGVYQILKSLELVHNNKIGFKLIKADLSEHNSQFAYQLIARHSFITICLDQLALFYKLFQKRTSVFLLLFEQLACLFYHEIYVFVFRFLIASHHLLFVPIAFPSPSRVSIVFHDDLHLPKIILKIGKSAENSKHQRSLGNSSCARCHSERRVGSKRNKLNKAI